MDTAKQKQFLELLEPCRSDLMAYLRHQLWLKDSASGGWEDALQTVLLTAYQKFDEFGKGTDMSPDTATAGGQAGFRAWIFQIATYTVFNINRRVEKESMMNRPLPDDLSNGTAPFFIKKGAVPYQNPEDIINWPENFKDNESYRRFLQQSEVWLGNMADEIKEALLVLNPAERDVFLLRSVGGFSYGEIAGILSIPPGSVMGNLARARGKLRKRLSASNQ